MSLFGPLSEPLSSPLSLPLSGRAGPVPMDYARWEFGDFPNGYRMRGKATPLSFSRDGGASFTDADRLLAIAGPNVLRSDHDPLTGEGLGGLFEGQKPNLLLYSNRYDTWWGVGQVTIQSGGDSPLGPNTATRLVATEVNGSHRVLSPGVGVGAVGSVFTASVFAKAEGYNFTRLTFANTNEVAASNIIVDLTNGDIVWRSATAGMGLVTTIVPYPNGWYRIALTITTIDADPPRFHIRPNKDEVSSTWEGDGVSGVLFAGAQVESGGLSSYIPTNGSAVVRQADTCVISDLAGAGFDPAGGMILCKVRAYPGSVAPATSMGFMRFGEGGSNRLFIENSESFGVRGRVGGIVTAAGTGALSSTDWEYLALCWSSANGSYFARKKGNGLVQVTSSLGNYTPSEVPSVASVAQNLNGHLRTLELHAGQFSAADLEAALNAFADS